MSLPGGKGGKSATPRIRINREIRGKEVRLIGLGGEQLGIVPVPEALRKAEEVGYDLVEVAPAATPPVCRIMDYGKYKYEQQKKQHSAKQRASHLKEVKFRPFTNRHDLEFKVKHALRFLEEGHKVKVTVMFRGRELAYQDAGRALLAKVVEQVGVHGQLEIPARMEGYNLSMTLTPKG